MFRSEPLDPIEETLSLWHNPLPLPQSVDFYDVNLPRGVRYTIPPGGQREIPSRYDFAIQRVLCADPQCRSKQHGFCMRGHDGQVMGGMAPNLIKQGQTRVSHPLDPALDPTLQEKRRLEAEQAAAIIARRSADETLLIAEAKKQAAEAQLDAVAKAGDPKKK